MHLQGEQPLLEGGETCWLLSRTKGRQRQSLVGLSRAPNPWVGHGRAAKIRAFCWMLLKEKPPGSTEKRPTRRRSEELAEKGCSEIWSEDKGVLTWESPYEEDRGFGLFRPRKFREDPHDTKEQKHGIRFIAFLVLAVSDWSIHRYLGSWPHKLPYLVTDLVTRHAQEDGRSSERFIGQLTS